MDKLTLQDFQKLFDAQEQRLVKMLDAQKKDIMDTVNARMDTQEQNFNAQMATQKEDLLTAIHDAVAPINLYIENDLKRNLNLLREGQLDLSRKIEGVQASLDEITPTVNALDILHELDG